MTAGDILARFAEIDCAHGDGVGIMIAADAERRFPRRHFNRGTLGLQRPSASVSPRRVISGGGRGDFRPLHSQAIGDNARHSDVGRICRWIYGTTWAPSLVPDTCQEYPLRSEAEL
jgi:hypothetical protein